MSPLWRTGSSSARRQPARAESTVPREVALVCLADGLVGVSFGATTVAGHLPWWVPIALSLLVFAGGSQFAAVGVVLSGGSPLAAVAAGAVLNARLLPYGFAVADVVGPPEHGARGPAEAGRSGQAGGDGPAAERPGVGRIRSVCSSWLIRLVGAQVITDESTAFALRQTDQARRRPAFWTCGLALFAVWNVSVVLGVLAGSVVRDTNAFGLDATFPAVLIALALPALDGVRTRLSAGTGAVIAVGLTPVLPAGLPVLAALAGLAAGWHPGRRPGARAASNRMPGHPAGNGTAPNSSSNRMPDHPTGNATTPNSSSNRMPDHPTGNGTMPNSSSSPTVARPAGAATTAQPVSEGIAASAPSGRLSPAQPATKPTSASTVTHSLSGRREV